LTVCYCVTDKFQYWRLSPNHKAFYYGDCGENDSPSLEQLHSKVVILDIKQLITGEKCKHLVKASNKKVEVLKHYSFSK